MNHFSHVEILFEGCNEPEKRYQKLIELGRSLDQLPAHQQTEENLVRGCQSEVFLDAYIQDGKVFFQAASDALISKGLAALLLLAYNGQTPEFILKEKPSFTKTLGIADTLSPGRSNGLASMYLHMQRLSLKFLASIS